MHVLLEETYSSLASVILLTFLSTSGCFFLILFVGSSSSIPLVRVGFFRAPCPSLSALPPEVISSIPLALRPLIDCWLPHFYLQLWPYFKLWSCMYGYWWDIFKYMSPRFLQLTTFSVEHLISSHQTISSLFHLVTPLFTQLFRADNWQSSLTPLFLTFYSLSYPPPRMLTISKCFWFYLHCTSLICPLCLWSLSQLHSSK